jgi:hypothetical protein
VNEFIVSADIAKRRDFFGLMVLRDKPDIIPASAALETPDRIVHFFDVSRIEKYQGLTYEEMADRIAIVMDHIHLRNNSDVLIDGTGVGEAAVEQVRKRGLSPVPIIFTGGETYSEKYAGFGSLFKGAPGQLNTAHILKEIHVPKKDLVAAGSVLLQQKRVRVAAGRWKEDFMKQMKAFRGKVNETKGGRKHISYEAENESDHDDLVVCYLMAAWWIQHRRARDEIPERRLPVKENMTNWEPLDLI